MKKVQLFNNYDFFGLYVDGDLVYEDNQEPSSEILAKALGLEYFYKQTQIEGLINFPSTVEDLEK